MKVRVIIGILTFGMFFTYQMTRFNINIAMVAIAKEELQNNGTSTWDSKPLILGAFFYVGWITELLGNLLFSKFGCRLVMTVAFLLNSIGCFLFPSAYYIHPIFGFVVRVIQGITLGCTYPAVAWLSARWIPKNERARYMSTIHGASLGASFTNLLGGIIIDQLGWSYIFYLTGTLCIIWVLCWWPLVYDTPSEHPKISPAELEYLKQNVEGNTTRKNKQSIPWSDIFTSIPFLVIALMFFCLMWFNVTLAMQIPTYYDRVHSLNITTNGMLLCIPDLVKLFIGIQFPLIVDKLITKDIIAVSTGRKISIGVGYLIPGVLLIILAYFGNQHIAVAATILIISISLNGAGAASVLASVIDLSPNHAGMLMGMVKTVANIPGVLSPIIVKYILDDGDPKNWTTIFLITAALLLLCTTIYLLFSSTEIQPWDNKERERTLNLEEKSDLLVNNKKIQIISENNSAEVKL